MEWNQWYTYRPNRRGYVFASIVISKKTKELIQLYVWNLIPPRFSGKLNTEFQFVVMVGYSEYLIRVCNNSIEFLVKKM
jgi:hypothetical protein